MNITAIDLFAGLGGFTEGARLAGIKTVWAGNHWQLACQYFEANHAFRPACQDLHQADWSVVPSHDFLLASPACQGHSRARGKDKPHHDLMRATAWAVVAATEYHQPKAIVIENVKEFLQWSLYPSWKDALQRLGYAVSPHVIDAADCGVPQNRVRAFVVCVRSKAPICLRLPKRDHVPATSFIDFNAGNWTAVNRRGRSQKTLERVKNGRAVHGEQFLASYYGNTTTGRSLNRPIGTITTRDRWAIINGQQMRMLNVSEAKRAMGFGETYRLPGNSREAMHLLGNAVPPPMARDVLEALQEQM